MQRLRRFMKDVGVVLGVMGVGYMLLAYPGQILFALMLTGFVIVLIDGGGRLVSWIYRKNKKG